jgi:fructoselysine-6-P-deglycase FrlB-like protein
MMNSIDALRLDFQSQVSELGNIRYDKISDRLTYIGSGDSYVAGLITEYLTDHKNTCYSPSDLSNSKLDKDMTYCFVSVTGKTKANISIAKRASKIGARTVAITFKQDSELAAACDKVICPKVKRANTPTAGFASFVANVVTCMQIAGLKVPQSFDIWHNNATKKSQHHLKSAILSKNTVFLLGNNMLYPIALYASFQMAEFFGSKTVAYKLEEYCHSPIFGVKKNDCVWILGQNELDVKRILDKIGISLSYIELFNDDVFAQVFESIFFVQSLMLRLSSKYKTNELRYVTMKDLLRASSEIIYSKSH